MSLTLSCLSQHISKTKNLLHLTSHISNESQRYLTILCKFDAYLRTTEHVSTNLGKSQLYLMHIIIYPIDESKNLISRTSTSKITTTMKVASSNPQVVLSKSFCKIIIISNLNPSARVPKILL